MLRAKTIEGIHLMILHSETPFRFVRRDISGMSLRECNCSLFDREKPSNARDFMDEYVVHLLNEQNWPKDKPIRILDIGSGGLLQIATIMTSLANNGYLAELVLVEEEIASKGDYVRCLERLFKTINAQSGKDLIRLIGQFSSVDSYLARVVGDAPLKFHQVGLLSPMEKQSLREKGIKARYLVPYFGSHALANEQFAKEFRESELCTGKAPDLILLIDDINEFHPYAVTREEYGGLSYFFHNEVVEPFRKLNQESVFLATKKSIGEVKVLKYSSESEFVGKVIHDYKHLQESDEYVVVTSALPVITTAVESTTQSVPPVNTFTPSTSDNVSTGPQPLDKPVTKQKPTADSKTRNQPRRFIIAMIAGAIGAGIGVGLVMTGVFAPLGAGFLATVATGAVAAIIGVGLAELYHFAYKKLFNHDETTFRETTHQRDQESEDGVSYSRMAANGLVSRPLNERPAVAPLTRIDEQQSATQQGNRLRPFYASSDRTISTSHFAP